MKKTNIFGHCALTLENFRFENDFHLSIPFSKTSRLERKREFSDSPQIRVHGITFESGSFGAASNPEIIRNRKIVEGHDDSSSYSPNRFPRDAVVLNPGFPVQKSTPRE